MECDFDPFFVYRLSALFTAVTRGCGQVDLCTHRTFAYAYHRSGVSAWFAALYALWTDAEGSSRCSLPFSHPVLYPTITGFLGAVSSVST